MPITSYIAGNGMIFGEKTSSGSRIDYVSDALGSVVAAVDQTLTTVFTARYTPSGSILTQTGTARAFGWVGTYGYLSAAGVSYADYSVRARFYGSKTGRWSSVDQLWPGEPAYEYAASSPVSIIDPSGLRPSLSYETIFVNECSCGDHSPYIPARWLIEWVLTGFDAKGSANNGYIVQQVVAIQSARSCREDAIPNTDTAWMNGWQVKNGTIYSGYASHGITPGYDFKQTGVGDVHNCTASYFQYNLVAGFFNSPAAVADISTWTEWQYAFGIELYRNTYSRGQPAWFFTPDSNYVVRTMTTTSVCCKCGMLFVLPEQERCASIFAG